MLFWNKYICAYLDLCAYFQFIFIDFHIRTVQTSTKVNRSKMQQCLATPKNYKNSVRFIAFWMLVIPLLGELTNKQRRKKRPWQRYKSTVRVYIVPISLYCLCISVVVNCENAVAATDKESNGSIFISNILCIWIVTIRYWSYVSSSLK